MPSGQVRSVAVNASRLQLLAVIGFGALDPGVVPAGGVGELKRFKVPSIVVYHKRVVNG